MTRSTEQRELSEVVCTACGCMCDDLTLTLSGDRVARVTPDCPLAVQHFENAAPSAAECVIQGEPKSLDAATAHAADILSSARAPLVMGLEQSTTEAVRTAIGIADRLRGYVDPTDQCGRSQNHVAVQSVGAVSATLGEAANRADLIVYWQVDPAESHPRHLERFASKADRVIVVDDRETKTSRQADRLIKLDASRQFEALCILREHVLQHAGGSPIAASASAPASPITALNAVPAEERDELPDLARQLAAARYAVIFYEPTGDHPSGPAALSQAIAELVRDLHCQTRAVALRLGRPGNAVGASQALTWQTGFPAAVSFRRGYPEYFPGEATAKRLLAHGEVDAALIVGADPLAHWGEAAGGRLKRVPTIVLDDQPTATMQAATVAIRTAPFGICDSGDVYRSDGVALPLTPVIHSQAPISAAALTAISRAIAARA